MDITSYTKSHENNFSSLQISCWNNARIETTRYSGGEFCKPCNSSQCLLTRYLNYKSNARKITKSEYYLSPEHEKLNLITNCFIIILFLLISCCQTSKFKICLFIKYTGKLTLLMLFKILLT